MAATAQEADKRAKLFLRGLCNPNSKLEVPQFEHSFDRTALRYLAFDSITADRPGHITCELPAIKDVCNAMGTLHGGCIGAPRGFLMCSVTLFHLAHCWPSNWEHAGGGYTYSHAVRITCSQSSTLQPVPCLLHHMLQMVLNK